MLIIVCCWRDDDVGFKVDRIDEGIRASRDIKSARTYDSFLSDSFHPSNVHWSISFCRAKLDERVHRRWKSQLWKIFARHADWKRALPIITVNFVLHYAIYSRGISRNPSPPFLANISVFTRINFTRIHPRLLFPPNLSESSPRGFTGLHYYKLRQTPLRCVRETKIDGN